MKTRIFAAMMAAILACSMQAAEVLKVTVQNPLNTVREAEMVELNLADLRKRLNIAEDQKGLLIVTDQDEKEVPSQVTYDGKLIFQAYVGPKGKSIYFVKPGTPAAYPAQVHGRQFPERVDDMAWENNRVAFRTYGPALQRSGERAWGYDIWNKRTSDLVIERRFADELDPKVSDVCKMLRQRGENDLADDLYNAVSYHVDHGNGMDCYKVGPTLGAGTAALLDEAQNIVYPRCYASYQILDEGPIRFTVKLTYEQRTLGSQTYTETRIISLDAGSQLNKVILAYEGLNQPAPFAVGIVVHNENPSAYVLNTESNYMAYEDLGDPTQYKPKYREKQNKDFGKIYVGTIQTTPVQMLFQAKEGLPGATGHILATATYVPSHPVTYYFGTAWSRNPNTGITSLTEWEAYLSQFAKQLQSPLKVKVK